MMRGIEEWNRHAVPAVRDSAGNIVTPGHDPYGGTGEWSYRRNATAVKAYWRDGIRRMVDQDFEGVVTLGMRGNGDTSLPDGDGIELMREIIADQREIIAEVTGKPVAKTPQVWTLYKEVQRYWDQGLRVARRRHRRLLRRQLGQHPQAARPGRAGRAQRRLRPLLPLRLRRRRPQLQVGRHRPTSATSGSSCTRPTRTGSTGLWVVNVGDLKNDELPLQFFLDYAWNPTRWPVERTWRSGNAGTRAQNFGAEHASAIAAVLAEYGQLQARRKPELLNRRITLDPAKDLADGRVGRRLRRPGHPLQPSAYREMERVDRGVAEAGGGGGAGRADAARRPTGRLLRARRLRGQGDRQPLRAARGRVHEPPVRRPRGARRPTTARRRRKPLCDEDLAMPTATTTRWRAASGTASRPSRTSTTGTWHGTGPTPPGSSPRRTTWRSRM